MPTLSQSAPASPSDALRQLRALAAPSRLRVTRDAEGWPVIPGRLGQVEWHDGAALAVYTDRPKLAVYTDRPKMIAKLWATPGVRRWQVGDQEARGLFPVDALPAVARVIGARRRRLGRPLTPEQALRLRAGARPSAVSAA